MSSGRTVGHEVRKSGEKSSPTTTSRVGMCVGEGGGSQAGCGWLYWM
jgi:hypothetical protein